MLRVQYNAELTTMQQNGTFGSIWFNPKGITNILSIPMLEKEGCRVIYNTTDD